MFPVTEGLFLTYFQFTQFFSKLFNGLQRPQKTQVLDENVQY
jgi:hypothetical protein